MIAFLPWALAGVAGWLAPKLLNLKEDWQRALLAALAGALMGYIL